MRQPETSLPGQIQIACGRLLLPPRLVVADDEVFAVAWQSWQARDGNLATAIGAVAGLELRAQLEFDHDALWCGVEVVNPGQTPIELRELAWQLHLDPPAQISLLDDGPASEETLLPGGAPPWELNLTHEILTDRGRRQRCLRLDYDADQFYVGSADPLTYGDGFVRVEPLEPASDRTKISWHRVEPHWDYNGLFSTRPSSGLWLYEGQTRAASLAIANSPQRLYRPWPTPAHPDAPIALYKAGSKAASERQAILDKIGSFRLLGCEYAGLFAGGYDHRNGRLIEPHASRPETGEILLHEYLRSGDARLWQWVIEFAECFQQLAVNRGRGASTGGAVRGRYGDNQTAHPIRSMRGAAFFWDMAALTGRQDYRETALGIARYLTRVMPWNNARQGAAIRDLVYLHRESGIAAFADTAQAILATVHEHQQPDGAWYEYWGESGQPSVYDSPGHHGGQWIAKACKKPEMAGYNINGILDALQIVDPPTLPAAEEIVQRAADWMLQTQSPQGPWPFPDASSSNLYGYGLFLDATAMLKAGDYFHDARYLASGRRAVGFGLDRLAATGMVPALIGVPELEATESSFTWTCALEAMAWYEHDG